jgi:hypothetical protein
VFYIGKIVYLYAAHFPPQKSDRHLFAVICGVSAFQSFYYRKKSRQGGLRGWQNFSGIPCRRRPAKKTITLAQIKAIA